MTKADERIVFTNRLRDAELDRLAATTRPYPGFFQPFIAKRAEWRVYVIGAETLSVRIQTADHAPGVDWRREQLDDSVRFCVGELPLDERRMCQEVVDRLGLRFAALDLIEREDGTFTFLEANPNGQYMWLEESLDLPVSPAIARALLAERGGWRSGG